MKDIRIKAREEGKERQKVRKKEKAKSNASATICPVQPTTHVPRK